MNNEYYGAASTPTEDFLAHYGIKGMKWGVRKAIERGGGRRLSRQFSKAERKLAKLTKRGNSGKKNAGKAVRRAIGAAAAGGLALAGTAGVATGLRKAIRPAARATGEIGKAMIKATGTNRNNVASAIRRAGASMYNNRSNVGQALTRAATAVDKFGNKKSIGAAVGNAIGNGGNRAVTNTLNVLRKNGGKYGNAAATNLVRTNTVQNVRDLANRVATGARGLSNSQYAKIAAGVVAAGLGAAAARKAYKAATAKRARRQADEFRGEMNKAFAGTKYANGRPAKKRRR